VDEITADFNVGAIENRDFRTSFADERDEAGHLRIVNEDDIGTTGGKRATFREPVPLCIVFDPLRELLLLRKREAKRRVGNALEDVYRISIASVYARQEPTIDSLWLFLVVLKTAGEGLGMYHLASTPRRWKSLIRAWRIKATPPP
jgi:hypothetical protein